jgi:hypothetical protein
MFKIIFVFSRQILVQQLDHLLAGEVRAASGWFFGHNVF